MVEASPPVAKGTTEQGRPPAQVKSIEDCPVLVGHGSLPAAVCRASIGLCFDEKIHPFPLEIRVLTPFLCDFLS